MNLVITNTNSHFIPSSPCGPFFNSRINIQNISYQTFVTSLKKWTVYISKCKKWSCTWDNCGQLWTFKFSNYFYAILNFSQVSPSFLTSSSASSKSWWPHCIDFFVQKPHVGKHGKVNTADPEVTPYEKIVDMSR